jgi:putative serine protease PepD
MANPATSASGLPSPVIRPKTAEQLIATGKATRPVIGIMMDTSYQGEGVKIEDGPTRGGPADKAGPRAGDVIIKFDGRPVTGLNEFVVPIRAQSVGEEVELTVLRGNSERTVKMTLQAAN